MNGGTVVKHGGIRLAARLERGQLIGWLFLALLVPPTAHAQVDGAVKSVMHSFVLEFAKMSPYLLSEEAFISPKGNAVIRESLVNLEKRVNRIPPPELKKSPGFRITYALLADHLTKTKEVFEHGEMEYARARMNGIGNLCAACHMQQPNISKFSAFEFVVERSKVPSFDNASFLFVIRRYDESLKMIDTLIRKYPEAALTSDQLGEAYRRKLAILARVYRDSVAATVSLNEDLKNKNLPADVRQNVRNWIDNLAQWNAEKVNPAKMKTDELLRYAAEHLPATLNRKIAPSDPQLLNVLRLSGLLYDRLYKEAAGPNAQGLLYYLARCERSLAPNYWYSMNEIYLKECIVQFPKQAFSGKCHEAYAEGMRERYFGKPLPEGVQRSLEALKQYL